MSFEDSIVFITTEGYEYLINFSLFPPSILPDSIDFPVIDCVIATDNDKIKNNPFTLFSFIKIIEEYITNHDVILYCYCDVKEIYRTGRNLELTPQAFRYRLFKTLYNRCNNPSFILKKVVLTDANGEDHYIILISRVINVEILESLTMNLTDLNK